MLKFLARFFVVLVCCVGFSSHCFAKRTCPAGEYNSGADNCQNCPPGCYCPYLQDADGPSSSHTKITNLCKNGNLSGDDWDLQERRQFELGNVVLCNEEIDGKEYKYSDSNSYTKYDCYYEDDEGRRYYKPISCKPGEYVVMGTGDLPTCMSCIGDTYDCPGGDFEVPHTIRMEQGRYDCPVGYTCKDGKKEPCPAGTEKPYPRGGECTDCVNGEYSEKGWAQCKQCPNGYWCMDPDKQHTKQPCPKGHYCMDGEKIECPKGTYSEGGETCHNGICTSIPVISCTECPAGTYAEEKGLDKCVLCGPNTANDKHGSVTASDCKPCPPNSNAPAGSAYCSGCPEGQYLYIDIEGDGSSECVACAAGEVVNSTFNGCDKCPIGTYAKDGRCVDCDESKGEYTAESSQTYCLSCPRGKVPKYKWSADGFSRTEFLQCTVACPDGYISADEGEGEFCAKLCSEPGFGWDSVKNSCEKCPDGTFRRAGDINNALCQPCMDSEYMEKVSSYYACLVINKSKPDPEAECESLFAPRLYSFGAGKEQCTTCPSGSCCIENNNSEGIITAVAYLCNRGTYGHGTTCNKETNKTCRIINGKQVCRSTSAEPAPGACTPCPVGTTTTYKGAKEESECVVTIGKYCIPGGDNGEICFSWPKKINLYENDIERQNMSFPD